jgi:8-oxo-dGTP pyrophosphatase MutT (NUDIX family)
MWRAIISGMQDRAGAIIIKNQALLLVSGHASDLYWTPGGKIDNNETAETTLRRELQEELGVNAKSLTPFAHITSTNSITGQEQTTKYCLVEIDAEPIPNNEISSIHWYTREDFKNGFPRISKTMREVTYPKLRNAELI